MKKQFIDQFTNPGTTVDSPFAAGKVDFRDRETGDSFLLFSIKDRTGELPAVLWDVPPDLKSNLKPGTVIHVSGTTQDDSKHGFQVKANSIRVLNPEEYQKEDYIAVSKRPTVEMEREIKDFISQIQNPSLKEFMTSWYLDPAFFKEFMSATAAKRIHHSCIGGLAEHTLEVVNIALDMAKHYPEINKDIIIAGCLVHDIGKIRDYAIDTTIEMSDDGKLMNHIPNGFAMLRDAAKEKNKLEEKYIKHLCHIILSHHGSSDMGSMVEPRTIEAMAIHLADLTSGQLNQYSKVLSAEIASGTDWTKKDYFLEKELYKGFNE